MQNLIGSLLSPLDIRITDTTKYYLKDTEANHCRTNELTYGETFRWTRLQAVQKLLKYREALRRQDQCHTNQLKYGKTFRGQAFSRTKELTRGETFIKQD